MEAQGYKSNLCEECQGIFRGVKRIWATDNNYDWEYYRHSRHPQRSWVDCVNSSAQQGCYICHIVSCSLAADARIGYCPRLDSDLKYFIRDKPWSGPKHPDVLYTIVFKYNRRHSLGSVIEDPFYIPISIIKKHGIDHLEPINMALFIILTSMAAIQNLLPDGINGKNSTNSNRGWQCISSWMKTCLDNHPRCIQERKPDWWPTRLLEVGDSLTGNNLRLIITSETPPSGPYVTLSHCWGSAQITKLTENTLEAMKESISMHSVPKTFVDAITAVKRLGVRYLWIDSFCIVQGSSIDWQAESSQMSEIYQNGLCNLSATGASDSQGGLFFDRDLIKILPPKVLLEWVGMEKVEAFAVDTGIWERFFIESPLISRAWVVQERILAPRIIHFGQRQLGWECHEKEYCEIFPRGFPPSISTLALKNLDPHQRREDDPSTDWRGNVSRIWNRIVHDYSKRNLTVESDKEAAISGIATRISRLRENDTLVAGLWRQEFLRELHWQPDNFVVQPKNYRAPSWSWLSVDGCINISRRHHRDCDQVSWAVVEDVQINRINQSPLAPIRSGRLSLRGTLQKAYLSHIPGMAFCDVELHGRRIQKFYARRDTFQASEAEQVWFLLLYTHRRQYGSSDNPHKKELF